MVGIEDEADDLLHGFGRHGGLLHALLVAVDAPGVAAEGGQDGIAPDALLFIVGAHEAGDLVIIRALVLPLRHQKLRRDQVVKALPCPRGRGQRPFDALLGQVLEHVILPVVGKGDRVLGRYVLDLRARHNRRQKLFECRVGFSYFDHRNTLSCCALL